MDKYTWIYYLVAFCIGLIISLILTFPAMWLWNYLMPMIFGLPKLTFWQTFGLQVLAACIFPTSTRGGRE